MSGTTDKTAEHAQALYGSPAPSKIAPPAPTPGDTGQKPWDAMYGTPKADPAPIPKPAARSAPAPAAATQPNATAKAPTDFNAIYGDVHREPEPVQVSVTDLVAAPQGPHAAVYPEGGQPLAEANDYDRQALGETFDGLAQEARHDGNEVDEALLSEGQHEAAALMAELAVPGETAREIARELEGYQRV